MRNQTHKDTLRKNMLKIRASIISDQKEIGDALIFEKLTSLEAFKKAESLLIYGSNKSEADTFKIIEYALMTGNKVALPKVTGPGEMHFYRIRSLSDTVSGYRGIKEPLSCEEEMTEGLMISPGVAFDECCNRMGYGGGFYDRFINKHRDHIFVCALCYEEQIVNMIPVDAYDMPMDMIITPRRILLNKSFGE